MAKPTKYFTSEFIVQIKGIISDAQNKAIRAVDTDVLENWREDF